MEYNSGHKIGLDDKTDSYAWFDLRENVCHHHVSKEYNLTAGMNVSNISGLTRKSVHRTGMPLPKSHLEKGFICNCNSIA